MTGGTLSSWCPSVTTAGLGGGPHCPIFHGELQRLREAESVTLKVTLQRLVEPRQEFRSVWLQSRLLGPGLGHDASRCLKHEASGAWVFTAQVSVS